MRDWPRNDARLRRSRAEIRQARKLDGLVDERIGRRLRKATPGGGRPIQRIRSVTGAAREWRADSGRKYRGHRRSEDRVRGIAKSARETSRRSQQENRRLHAGATLFSRVRGNLALENPGRRTEASLEHRPAFAGTLSSERAALGSFGVRESVQHSRRFADGASGRQTREHLASLPD